MRIIINKVQSPSLALALALALAAGLPGIQAAERHFAYAQESAVLAPGNAEFEVQSTYQRGKTDYWVCQEHRLEVEVGLVENLMGAFYLNLEQTTAATGPADPTLRRDSMQGASLELKYKLSDPVADPVGSAVYGEATASGDEVEYELKGILDKQIGGTLVALNGVYEVSFEQESAEERTREVKAGAVFSAVHAIRERTQAGLELDWRNVRTEDGWTDAALFAGPVVHHNLGKAWLTGTVMPQIAGLKKADGTSGKNLDEFHQWEARVVVGVDF